MDLLGLTSNKLVFFFTSFLAIQLVNALAPSTYVDHSCTLSTLDDDNSLSFKSINSLLSNLILHSSNSTFYSSTSDPGENKTYGFFYCTADVNSQDCQSCVKSAANDSQSYCGPLMAAKVFYRECTLQYSDSPLYGASDVWYSSWVYSPVAVSYKRFNKTMYSTLETVIAQAANGPGNKGFATSDTRLVGTKERLYAFAQCTPDILGSACENCLGLALEHYPDDSDYSRWGPERTYMMVFYPNCQLRHEFRKPSSKGMIPSSLSESESSMPSSRRGWKVYWYIIVQWLRRAAVALH